MAGTNRIEILFSKSKLVKLLVFSIIFLIAGLWMVITQPQTSNVVFNNPIVFNAAAYGGMLMGVLGVYFFTKKLFDTRPGIIVDENGITDNTGAFSFGFIPWSDMSEIRERSVQASVTSKQRYVTIGLKDPGAYILKEPNAAKRKFMTLNAKKGESPVHISANS